MSEWKCLVVFFNECDVVLGGKTYKDKLTTTQKQDAKDGFALFSKWVSATTGGRESFQFDYLEVPTLRHMDSYQKTPVDPADAKKGWVAWARPRNVYDSIMAAHGSWNIHWGKYDSVFVVQPWEAGPTGLDGTYHLNGLGYYPAQSFTKDNPKATLVPEDVAFGATYAWFGGMADMKKHDAGLITHEWLHGVCQFYLHYDFPVPKSESHEDPAWRYTFSPTNGWNDFYRDLINGDLKDQFAPYTPRGGIPLEAWTAGTTGNPRNLVGRGAKDPQAFRKAWGGRAGGPASTRKNVHAWGDGEAQDMVSTGGRCAVLKGEGRDAQVLPPALWRKFLESGDVTGLGYPKSDVHTWGKGTIMDFETKSGWHSGILEAASDGVLRVVKGQIWKAYVATQGNGATSYLGYPTGEEYLWTQPDSGKQYHVQFFEGGYCWAQNFSPYKYGNDRQWKDQREELGGDDLGTLDEAWRERAERGGGEAHTCCQPPGE